MKNTGMTRRRFLGSTAAMTGAMLAGNAVRLEASAGVLGQDSSEAKPVRFGMIGVGMRGAGLLGTAIRLPGVECVAVSELYDGRAELAREIIGKSVPVTRRYHELLERKDIDCIIAAIPDHWHKQAIVDACNAGKDIYCEKPMTHKPEEGQQIIEAAQKNQRIVQIGSQEPSSVVYAKAKELIAAGAIGDVVLIESTLGRNSPCGAWRYTIPTDLSEKTLDWETWLGSAPKRPFSPERFARWRCWRDYGEGATGDLFIHQITGIHYVMGVTAPPRRAHSCGGLFRWKDGRDVPDVLTTAYDYDGFCVTLRVTLNSDEDEIYRFLGTKGILEIHGIENPGMIVIHSQDGKDHGPCTPAWPRQLRADYDAKWNSEHPRPAPGSYSVVGGQSWYAPPGYDDTRDHLWNYFESVRTRRPSVEGPVFANNAALAAHMADASYEAKTVARWNHSSNRIEV